MDITALAIAIMDALGGPGTALVIAAEAVFPPIPGEVLLPFAGVSAAEAQQSVLVPVFWTTLGSVLGGLVMHTLGRALGLERARHLFDRIPLMKSSDVDAAVRFFDRYGFWAVLLARFVPMVRTFISIPAGIERMPLWLFALATGTGSGIWNAVFVVTGYLFGVAGGAALNRFVQVYSLFLAVMGAIALVGFLRSRWKEKRRPHAEAERAEAERAAE